MSTLKLSLRKQPFDEILSGKKRYEFRDPSAWIESRLYNGNQPRKYEYVEFTNGYGNDKPWLRCQFKGVQVMKRGEKLGGYVAPGKTYAIKLGQVEARKNIKR